MLATCLCTSQNENRTNMKTPSIISYVYGVLLIVGGVMGFVMGKSVPSLISGGGGGLLMLLAGRGFGQRQSWALPLGLVVALAVAVFFGRNINSEEAKVKNRALGMTALSALTIVGLLATGTRKN
jgi:uncharacterized membrane protein (UPF0136 family)